MILTAHQPVYLPWLGLFHKIVMADQFVSFNQVQYQPKDWNNRNQVKTPQGPVWLSVPVMRKGFLDKKICDIEINNNVKWRHKHWNTMLHNYGKTPYFKKYADYFEGVYGQDWTSLVELNESMLAWFLAELGIKVPIKFAGDYDFQGVKSDMVLDMCKQLGADTYIFGEQGRGYADEASFEASGVKAIFQDYHHPVYAQLHGDFVSHMSIVDLLFNCGDDSLEILMSGNGAA